MTTSSLLYRMKILIKAEEYFPGGLFSSSQRWSFISLEERNRSEAMLELVFTRLARRVRMIYSRRRLRDAPDFHSFFFLYSPQNRVPLFQSVENFNALTLIAISSNHY